jgi:hypothetical protein
MRTVELPAETWTRTLDEFSALHEGWLVSLDVLEETIGAQHAIDNLPLLGVSADPTDGAIAITISAGGLAEHITHTIHAPTRVQIERREDGADVALQIESAGGARAILQFRVAALPETVDGVVNR